MTQQTWLAIFVGGASSRMGGEPKGLLNTESEGVEESIVHRHLRHASALDLYPVFVGAAEPYALQFTDIRVIADDPEGVGPLGGLSGVLKAAGDAQVLALACDMPYVTTTLLSRLITSASHAAVLATRSLEGRWDPLCARYDPARVLPVLQTALSQGVHSFQRLYGLLPVTELELAEAERAQLHDWDTPEDIVR